MRAGVSTFTYLLQVPGNGSNPISGAASKTHKAPLRSLSNL